MRSVGHAPADKPTRAPASTVPTHVRNDYDNEQGHPSARHHPDWLPRQRKDHPGEPHSKTNKDHGKKIAIIENEFGDVGIDDALMAKNTKEQIEEEIVEMMKKTPVDETRRLLPFTVLSGFLGAGKTTLLKKILREPAFIRDPITGETRPRKIAVIVNDMGAVNLDADEIKRHNVLQEEAEMVELHNGCVCCTYAATCSRTSKNSQRRIRTTTPSSRPPESPNLCP